MGCKSSKSAAHEDSTTKLKEEDESDDYSQKSGGKPVNMSRMSQSYQADELGSNRMSSSDNLPKRKSSSAMKSQLGTHTRHGVMPGPRGYVAAKINQDRGVVYWPYNNSFNESLLCVFDGHGSKGEKVSECCMDLLPKRLESDMAALRADPAGVLSTTVIQFDKELLAGSLGPQAHTCGTTSIIVYLNGNTCWTACSGDSRAVLGQLKGGKYVAQDLSEDCKPDTPSETVRIRQCGGVVSPSVGGRPSRVWANGRIGLAMSRSLGDGECKRFGVIADPEIKHFTLKPSAETEDPKTGRKIDGDGDKFIIVASDGVWEFIESDEAVQIVAQSGDASSACAELVQQAAHRWKVNEGNYRDDITAIVAYLPFLQPEWDDDEEDAAAKAAEPGNERQSKARKEEQDENAIMVNQGMVGLSRMESGDMSPDPMKREALKKEQEAAKKARAERAAGGGAASPEGEGEEEDTPTNTFAKRRLSMNNPFENDDDWLQLEPGTPHGDEGDDPNDPPKEERI